MAHLIFDIEHQIDLDKIRLNIKDNDIMGNTHIYSRRLVIW